MPQAANPSRAEGVSCSPPPPSTDHPDPESWTLDSLRNSRQVTSLAAKGACRHSLFTRQGEGEELGTSSASSSIGVAVAGTSQPEKGPKKVRQLFKIRSFDKEGKEE